jgi:hypothetical protein
MELVWQFYSIYGTVPKITNAVAVAAGYYDSLALTSDGNVIAWSYADFFADPDHRVIENLSNVTAIASSAFSSLALKRDGTVVSWGDVASPPPDLTNVIAISVASKSGLALKEDGTIVGWGENPWGALNIPENLQDVIAIAADDYHGLAAKSDGSVVAWGTQYYGETSVPEDLTNAIAVAVADGASFALKADGTVAAWGHDADGRNSSATNLTNIVAITGEGYSYLALTEDGKVVGPYYNLPVLNQISAVSDAGLRVQFVTTSFAPAVHAGVVAYYYFGRDDLYSGYPGAKIELHGNLDSPSPYRFQWKRNGVTLASASKTILKIPKLSARDAGTYTFVVSNAAGVTESHPVVVNLVAHHFTITSPTNRTETTNAFVIASGTIDPGHTMGRVFYNSTGYGDTNLFTYSTNITNGRMTVRWSATLPLKAGWNRLDFVSINMLGQVSPPLTREVFRRVRAPLTVVISGAGTVTPNLNGKLLEIGKVYKITATPGAGQFFQGWVEYFGEPPYLSYRTLYFEMEENKVLTAKFIPDPIPSRAGTYNGLFYQNYAINHGRSGSFTMQLNHSGTFSGAILLGGDRIPFTGNFGGQPPSTYKTLSYAYYSPSFSPNLAKVSFSVTHSNWSPLPVTLTLPLIDEDFGQLSGFIGSEDSPPKGSGYWTADLHAELVSKATNLNWNYTLAFADATNFTSSGSGDGIGNAKVDRQGNLRFIGKLSDGTSVSQSVRLPPSGHWPLYAPLYNGKGSLLSWGNLYGTNSQSIPTNSPYSWIKTGPTGTLYRDGFTNENWLVPSLYFNDLSRLAEPWDFGIGIVSNTIKLKPATITLDVGNLDEPMTADLVEWSRSIVPNGRPITIEDTARGWVDAVTGTNIVLTLNPTNGWLKGTFIHPKTHRKTSMTGVLMEDFGSAKGFFIGTNQSGSIHIKAQ